MTDDPLYRDALERFQQMIEEAQKLDLRDPTAMALATVDRNGLPSLRIVLMRGFDERGLMFYTNIHSRKGQELATNPRAAVCFHWEPLKSQIRLEGQVERLRDEDSDAYWATRPRESQISACVSEQSRPLDDWNVLTDRVAALEQQYAGEEIPRPDYWGGYRLIPNRIEFWHDQPARLHDRDVYERTEFGWTHGLLFP